MRRPVAIAAEDARHHLHVVGETGTGKSTLLANLVLRDAAAGRAAVVIDPKGDLVESTLERLPEGCEDRTCVVDPDDRKDAVGLNVLAGSDPDLIVDHVAGVFKRIYEPGWGPRTDDIMRAACLAQIPGRRSRRCRCSSRTSTGAGPSARGSPTSEGRPTSTHRPVGRRKRGYTSVHERFGFRRAGYHTEQGRKFGRYWDVAWYERSFPEVASATSG